MEVHHNEHPLSHEELKFREHRQRGIDFTRIDLFRSAREEFSRALIYMPGDTDIREKIDMCNRQIRQDTVKALVIVPVVLAVITAVILIAL
jgi:hypothetical protein